MKVDVSLSIMVTASAEKVFEWLTDLDRLHMWNGALLSINRKGRMHEGMIYQTQSHAMGHKIETSTEVRRLVLNRELELVNNTGAVSFRGVYRLISSGGQTELVLWAQLEPQSRVFQLARPLIESLAMARIRADHEALKALVEAEATA